MSGKIKFWMKRIRERERQRQRQREKRVGGWGSKV